MRFMGISAVLAASLLACAARATPAAPDAGAALAHPKPAPSVPISGPASAAPSSAGKAAAPQAAPAPAAAAQVPAAQGTAAQPAAAATTPPPATPAPLAPDVKALVDRMQAFYEKSTDFTASFEQVYRYQLSRRSQTSTGAVTFKKPGLMRWEYANPSPRTFVLAGEKVYAYDPEAKSLTIASIGTNQLSASVTFLWGKGRLADEFSIARVACKDCKGTLLELTPLRPDPRFKRIKLEVDPASAQVLRSTVVDPDGSENTISFKNLKINQDVKKEDFRLQPPAGTQVMDYTRMAAPEKAAP